MRGSILPAVFPRALLCGVLGILISIVHIGGIQIEIPALGNVVPSVVLGLLLVFRTNTAYERFWEGRKAWGDLINTVRNLARQIWVFVEEQEEGDHEKKSPESKVIGRVFRCDEATFAP
ncbi:bestrophin family ion channel [Neosynechococcus sphagnicola]|uniref:bestrophin family ion channel n=1 Tax=Neosynechococcus sphagnicola TaxID=1501145 RepID=UPI001EF9F84E|nr:bestrophin family ion channel [Neosynechococcus sphagnicola]